MDRHIGQIIPDDPKSIWKEEEVPYDEELDELTDDRPPPKYLVQSMIIIECILTLHNYEFVLDLIFFINNM